MDAVVCKNMKKALWTTLPNVNKAGQKVNPRREYIRQKARFIKEHPTCYACHTSPATQIHHSRGRTATLLTNERYWFAVCFACHRWIHDNIEWARAEGLICAKGDWGRQT